MGSGRRVLGSDRGQRDGQVGVEAAQPACLATAQAQLAWSASGRPRHRHALRIEDIRDVTPPNGAVRPLALRGLLLYESAIFHVHLTLQ